MSELEQFTSHMTQAALRARDISNQDVNIQISIGEDYFTVRAYDRISSKTKARRVTFLEVKSAVINVLLLAVEQVAKDVGAEVVG